MCKSMDGQDNSASVRYMRLRLRPAGTGPKSAHAMSRTMAVGSVSKRTCKHGCTHQVLSLEDESRSGQA